MKFEGVFKQYESIKEDMKFFTSSDVRSKILISLKDGSKNLGDLRSEMHISSSTILHAMNQLGERNFILKESGRYSLSQTGEIAASIIIHMMGSVHSLKKFQNLFLNHEIGSIPHPLLKDIGSLNNSKIIKSTPNDILKPHTTLSALMSRTTDIKHLSSVFHPLNTGILLQTIEKGGEVQLVLTRGVMEQLIETTGLETVNNALSTGKLKLWNVDEDMKISFTMGNDFVAMGLFSNEGVYDLNMFMVSEGDDAVSWGSNLFNHYLERAEKFEP